MPRRKSKSNLPEGIDLLPSSKYRWRVTAGYRDKNGKQVRASGTTETLKQAKIDQAKAKADFYRRILAMPNGEKLQDYALKWLEAQDVRPNTRKMYQTELGYAFEVLGHLPVRDVRPAHVKDALVRLKNRVMGAKKDEPKPKTAPKTMSTRTLGAVRARLWSVFGAAVAEQKIYINPVAATKRIRGNDGGEARRGVALDSTQAARFHELGEALHDAGVCRLWVALFIALSVGLRRGEVMGLRWRDIDFNNKTLMVRQNLTFVANKLTIGKPKTAKSVRDIPMPLSLLTAMQTQKLAMLEEAAQRGETLLPDSPVFATVTGEYTAPDNLKRALNSILEWSDLYKPPQPRRTTSRAKPRALQGEHTPLEKRLKGVPVAYRAKLEAIIREGQPLPKITPHDLRHTAATQMLQKRMPFEVVSAVLGHAKPSITLDVYRHVFKSEIKDQMIDLYPPQPPRVVASLPVN
jgi:integrase